MHVSKETYAAQTRVLSHEEIKGGRWIRAVERLPILDGCYLVRIANDPNKGSYTKELRKKAWHGRTIQGNDEVTEWFEDTGHMELVLRSHLLGDVSMDVAGAKDAVKGILAAEDARAVKEAVAATR